jgi:O-acetylserine/cysteine efflux transporter
MAAPDAALGLLAATIWAGAFLATETALRETPPLLFAALRFALTGAFALAVARPRIGWPRLLAIAALLGVAQHAFIFLGMAAGVPPGMAALLAHTQSFFTVALAVVVLGEALSARRVAAFALAAGGLALLLAERGTPMPPLAVLTVVAGALAAGIGNLVLRRSGAGDPVAIVAWMAALSTPPLLALSLALEGAAPLARALTTWSPALAGATLYSALLAALVAYAIWARLFARYESQRVAPFMLLVPPLGIAFSVAATGETLTAWRAAAAAAILAGLALAAWPRRG